MKKIIISKIDRFDREFKIKVSKKELKEIIEKNERRSFCVVDNHENLFEYFYNIANSETYVLNFNFKKKKYIDLKGGLIG